jgi:putative DNA primase/helicase
MSGLPDFNKSTVQIGYIACATARLPWPDGAPAIEPMNVIMLTAEDTLDQIIKPRLVAAGADISRVHILKAIKTDEHDRQFLLNEDLYRLEHLVKKIGNVGLITLDPITAYMGGRMDSYKATEVRSQLGPLKDFSERMNIALSTITHPPKAAGQRALDHFIASQAFIAACRVGHLCIAEMEEKNGEYIPTGRVLFTNVRNTTYRRLMQTLVYRKEEIIVGTVEQGFERLVTAPKIIWEGSVDITAEAAIAAVSGKKQPDLQLKAQAFLREMLKDGKPVPQKEIEDAAEKKGFTPKQLRTARQNLGVDVFKEPGTMSGGWFWQLPNPSKESYYY